MEIVTQIRASHPIVERQYARVLTTDPEIRLAEPGAAAHVGVFDGLLDSLPTTLTIALTQHPAMRSLLITPSCDENDCLRWLLHGVWGLVTYREYEEVLVRAVQHIAQGQCWFPLTVIHRWRQIEVARSSRTCLGLTNRENEVFELVCRKLSNKEIGATLHISERTVKFHVTNILNKLQVTSRHEIPFAAGIGHFLLSAGHHWSVR